MISTSRYVSWRNAACLQLREVMNVVEHLHQREDNYRRKIKASHTAKY
jgi:hypothetical protein